MRTTWMVTTALVLAAATFTTAFAAEKDMDKSIYAPWKYGPPADPGFFPIGVWAQDPRDAGKYKAIGVNTFMSLHRGPTDEQLATLKSHGMRTICHQNAVGLAHKDDPTIIAWMHGDEPDNLARRDDKWVPKRSTERIIADYKRIQAADPTRPILLNLGQGVANDEWKGGWAKEADYREFVKGCDIVSFDIYPACSQRPNVKGNLPLVALGVDRLRQWSEGKKIVWNILECTKINNPTTKATPAQVKAEVWMSLIHGSRGIVYFCHEFQTNPETKKRKTISNALLKDAEMSEAVGKINKQVHELAPVLNSPTVKDGATVATSEAKAPVDIMVKKRDGAVYLFAVGMKDGATRATFKIAGMAGEAAAEVIGEDRTVAVKDGGFADNFGPWDVHLYKITQ